MYRNRSRSDVSPLGFDPMSPFCGTRSDFLSAFEGPFNGNTPSRNSFFPEPILRQSSLGSVNPLNLDETPNSMIRLDARSYGETVTQDEFDWADMSYSNPSADDFLLTDRHWENIPLNELNFVPDEFEHLLVGEELPILRLGRLKGILLIYLRREMLASGVASEEVKKVIRDKSPSKDILTLARSHNLLPLAARLHLVNGGLVSMHPALNVYLTHIEDKRRLKAEKSQASEREIEEGMSGDNDGRLVINYYPGIRLMLGKERDTIIRPMITSIFRENREPFRAALVEAGLKYNELRIWTDAQLCTAIHVADSFRPGAWDVATNLHERKSGNRRRLPRRRRKRRRIN